MSRAFDPRRKFAFATASLRFVMLGKFTAQGHEGVSFFRASRRLHRETPSLAGSLGSWRLVVARPCSARSQSVVVGASRRSAAPGSQFMGAAGYGSSEFCSVVRSAPLAPSAPGFIVRPVLWLAIPAMPNYSIERTRPGKPGRASHVKRWASRSGKSAA
jgi:hypothetical protein